MNVTPNKFVRKLAVQIGTYPCHSENIPFYIYRIVGVCRGTAHTTLNNMPCIMQHLFVQDFEQR